jgi:hypothetical protein
MLPCKCRVDSDANRCQGGWSVTDLDLSHNVLYAAGGIAVFEALKNHHMQTLRRLKLVSCKLSSAQLGVSIGKALGAAETVCLLRELDIGWNDFDDTAMQVSRALCARKQFCVCVSSNSPIDNSCRRAFLMELFATVSCKPLT